MLGSTFTGAMQVNCATLEIAPSHGSASSVRISGKGQVKGDVIMPGTIAPGDSAGTLTFLEIVFFSQMKVDWKFQLKWCAKRESIPISWQLVNFATGSCRFRYSIVSFRNSATSLKL